MVDTLIDSRMAVATTPLDGSDPTDIQAPPDHVGRYALLDPIGQGGIGRVYRAWDPKLDRHVAIKVLHVGRRRVEDVQNRLRREAQAMARLNHPNVVEIYDVEVDRSALYIVMELVDGTTLLEWLHARPPRTEVLDVMLDAGRGLAAAHASGLVHRDFKPGNVMLREQDGRAQVLDFGLARALGAASDLPWDISSGTSDDPFALVVTGVGEVVGTPAYMSPEQHRGRPLGPSTDQYSFCVALFEALYGLRPFQSETRRGLARLKERGAPEHPPNQQIPARIRRIVDRGLAADPDQRWPSMDALLEGLELARRSERRRFAVTAGVGLIALVGTTAWMVGRPPPAGCAAASGLEDVWSDALRAEAAKAVRGALGPNAQRQWAKLERRLDDYAASWSSAYRAACDRTREGGPEAMDREMACLSSARSELAAVVDVLREADGPRTVAAATELAWQLNSPALCDHSATKFALGPRRVREQRHLESQLDRAKILRNSAQNERALAMLQGLLPQTRDEGDPRLFARALLELGTTEASLGRYEQASGHLEDAYAAALDAGLFELAAQAATRLVGLGSTVGRWSEAEEWAEHASSWLRRADAPPRRELAHLWMERSKLAGVRGELGESESFAFQALEAAREEYSEGPRLVPFVGTLGNAYLRQGRFAEAHEQYASALSLATDAYGEGHLLTSTLLNNIAGIYYRELDFASAAEYFGRAYEIESAVMTPDDPRLAPNLSNYATALAEAGRLEQAEPKLREAIELFEDTYGDNHPQVGVAWTNLGSALQSLGRLDEAREAQMRAVELFRDGLGQDHSRTADAIGNLASVERALGDLEASRALHEEALGIRRRVLGPDHTSVAVSLDNVGALESDAGNFNRASLLHRRALEIYETAQGPESTGAGDSRYLLGRALRGHGDLRQARDHLETAVQIRHERGVDRARLGRARFELAQVLAELGEPRARATALAHSALEDFRSRPGTAYADEIAQIEVWLHTQG